MLETQVVGGVRRQVPAPVSVGERPIPTATAALEHLTVGRDVVVGQLVRELACAGEPNAARIHLLIGPAGIGKSHVLELLDARIRRSSAIEERALVATLPEQNCPTSVVQLLARLLRALPDDPELGPSVDSVRSLQRQRDGDQEQRALELIRLRLRGRRLFILLDRLDEVLEVLGRQGAKRLRALLNEERDWTLVTSARDGSSALAGAMIHELDSLSAEQCAEMLARLADARGQAALAEQLATDTGLARVRALHHLLGGTPGAMARVAHTLDPARLDRIERVLADLDDVLEPELRERTGRLSPSQRGIVDILVESWRPLTVTQIAERAFAKQASTSGALRHLRREGLVRALEIGRERYYELCDPLHRLARPTRAAQTFAGILRDWYAQRASAGPSRPSPPTPTDACEAELDDAQAILAQSPAIAVGRLRGRLARSKSAVMTAALVLGLERGGRGREALEALAAVPPARVPATDLALTRLAAVVEGAPASAAAGLVRVILEGLEGAREPSQRRALLDALDQAAAATSRLLSDKLLRYPLVRAWAEAGAWSDLGRLLARLRPARTSPSLESDLIVVLESAWHAQRLPELFADAPSLAALLAIGSARVRARLAWARALASLDPRTDTPIDEDELLQDLRRSMGLEPSAPTWPRTSQLAELGPTGRAMILELLADPRSFALWSRTEGGEAFVDLAQTTLATGIYAWIASRRPLADLAELAARLREHSRVEVLPPALLASKTTREAHAHLAVSERALVREILALREPPTPADASRERQFTATDLQLL